MARGRSRRRLEPAQPFARARDDRSRARSRGPSGRDQRRSGPVSGSPDRHQAKRIGRRVRARPAVHGRRRGHRRRQARMRSRQLRASARLLAIARGAKLGSSESREASRALADWSGRRGVAQGRARARARQAARRAKRSTGSSRPKRAEPPDEPVRAPRRAADRGRLPRADEVLRAGADAEPASARLVDEARRSTRTSSPIGRSTCRRSCRSRATRSRAPRSSRRLSSAGDRGRAPADLAPPLLHLRDHRGDEVAAGVPRAPGGAVRRRALPGGDLRRDARHRGHLRRSPRLPGPRPLARDALGRRLLERVPALLLRPRGDRAAAGCS